MTTSVTALWRVMSCLTRVTCDNPCQAGLARHVTP